MHSLRVSVFWSVHSRIFSECNHFNYSRSVVKLNWSVVKMTTLQNQECRLGDRVKKVSGLLPAAAFFSS